MQQVRTVQQPNQCAPAPERRCTRVALGAVLSATILAAGLLAAIVPISGAFAGSNGQQIRLFNSVPTAFACIAGYNQNTSWVRFCWWLSSTGQGEYNDIGGYWWKYTVTIDRTDSGGNILATRSDCYVPVSQSSDWYSCLAP